MINIAWLAQALAVWFAQGLVALMLSGVCIGGWRNRRKPWNVFCTATMAAPFVAVLGGLHWLAVSRGF